MKIRGIIRLLLLGLLLMVLTVTTACGRGEEVNPQLPTGAGSGDTTGMVTGDGNIVASSHAKLSFSSGGKIDKIFVKAGDKVSRGDVLARLDASTLELAEAQAQAALSQAKLAWRTAERNMKDTQDTEGALNLAVLKAQTDVKTARFNLEQTVDAYTWSDIKTAQAAVDDARRYLDAQIERSGSLLVQNADGTYPGILEYILGEDFLKTSVYEGWQTELLNARARLSTAEDRLAAMLSGSDPAAVAIKKLQLEAAEQAEAQAQQKLNNGLMLISDDLAIKALAVETAGEMVNLARESLDRASQNLTRATIVAPFDGIVASVGAKEGEFLSPAAFSGTTIVEIVDLGNMELTVDVDELDVVRVKTGQQVLISIDALPERQLEGRVVFISPVAREPVGVVLFESDDEEQSYAVKIELEIPSGLPIRAGMSATAKIIVSVK